MGNLECPQCGNALANGVAVCGACGREVQDDEVVLPARDREKGPGRKSVYAILAVLLVFLGGAALLIFTGLLPNPMKGGGSTAAIVNGEKITTAEVDQKYDLYKKMSGKSGQPDSTTPEGKAAAADMKRQILKTMIQEKILVTEAAREKITVATQEIADRVAAIKKSMNRSDSDFETFLKNHAMTLANFEKRIEKDLLISKLVAKGTQEKGLAKEVWIGELSNRA
ncbi:MAG: SurA N-terminal domain-containing protein, partial [Syntrophaceae bacterium]|nr:SurA N-terminal domain-containing protein [Syntrophaceae bacterium]